tara:strand:- start:8887 stop:9390 length:504 start_codon:yes stop_codon:yes gene_type:complete
MPSKKTLLYDRKNQTLTKGFKKGGEWGRRRREKSIGLDRYEREKCIYKRKLDYIPQMISFDNEKREIIIEIKGKSLYDKYPLHHRRKFIPQIKELYKRFKDDTGLFHNDIRFQNILEENGKLYLIDFEYCGLYFTDTEKLAGRGDCVPFYTRDIYEAVGDFTNKQES